MIWRNSNAPASFQSGQTLKEPLASGQEAACEAISGRPPFLDRSDACACRQLVSWGWLMDIKIFRGTLRIQFVSGKADPSPSRRFDFGITRVASHLPLDCV
jgi:hypothetical protein